MQLLGKVAIVTGASQGLGKAFCEALLKRGVRVCLGDIKAQQGEATAKAFQQQFGKDKAIFVKCDVANEQELKGLFLSANAAFHRLDIVVNNAGIANENNWSLMVDVNLKGVIHGTNLAIDYMSKEKGGSGGLVVNVSSTAGLTPVYFTPAYSATKHGVVGFTNSWADNPNVDRFGVRFVTLCPAFTKTDIIDMEINQNSFLYKEEFAKIIQTVGVNTVEKVVEGFMQLVDDETNNGAVMTVTAQRGIRTRRKPAKL